jgi:hypothetical protein
MQTVIKFLRFYLQSLDTVVRLLGTCVIIGIMTAALGYFLHTINWIIYGKFTQGPMHTWLGLILLPPILRLGILAGGFSIPPLINRSKSREGIAKEQN